MHGELNFMLRSKSGRIKLGILGIIPRHSLNNNSHAFFNVSIVHVHVGQWLACPAEPLSLQREKLIQCNLAIDYKCSQHAGFCHANRGVLGGGGGGIINSQSE